MDASAVGTRAPVLPRCSSHTPAHLFTVADLELRSDDSEWEGVAAVCWQLPRDRIRLISQVHGTASPAIHKGTTGCVDAADRRRDRHRTTTAAALGGSRRRLRADSDRRSPAGCGRRRSRRLARDDAGDCRRGGGGADAGVRVPSPRTWSPRSDRASAPAAARWAPRSSRRSGRPATTTERIERWFETGASGQARISICGAPTASSWRGLG